MTTPPRANAPAPLPRLRVSTFPLFETMQASNLYCIAIRFKPSPFFYVDQAVSRIAECPGMRSQSTFIYMSNTPQSLLVLPIVVNKSCYFPSLLIR